MSVKNVARLHYTAQAFQCESVRRRANWTRECSISEVAGRIFCLSEEHPNNLWCSAFIAALSSFCLSMALSPWIKRLSCHNR